MVFEAEAPFSPGKSISPRRHGGTEKGRERLPKSPEFHLSKAALREFRELPRCRWARTSGLPLISLIADLRFETFQKILTLMSITRVK